MDTRIRELRTSRDMAGQEPADQGTVSLYRGGQPVVYRTVVVGLFLLFIFAAPCAAELLVSFDLRDVHAVTAAQSQGDANTCSGPCRVKYSSQRSCGCGLREFVRAASCLFCVQS